MTDNTSNSAAASDAPGEMASTSGDPPATEDDRVYLVPYGWWREAHESVEAEGLRGTPYTVTPVQAPTYHMKIINMFNSDQAFNLQRDIVEEGIDVSHRSYALIASDVWAQALRWYNESQETKEKCLSIDGSTDVYLLALRVSVRRETSTLTLKISKKDNNVEIHKRATKIFSADSDPVRMWDFSGQTNLILMNEWNRLPQSGHQTDQEILLHVHVLEPSTKPDSKKEESLPAQQQNKTSGFFYENGSNQIEDSDLFNGSFKSIGLGLIGLENLGNTCYMNSALQCLVHTSKLVDFFLGDFTKEINLFNPLGTKGELALAFGDLLRKLWSQDKAPVAPRHFKSKISRFAPQFRGYSQHDSQELLAFLLDGLHEDLNRVREKPYFEAKDCDSRPDAEVADDHWLYHLARNNSVIVDLCQGQYKSTLVCPVCNKVSVTFDPFMYLSLPIPSSGMRFMTVSLFGVDGTAPPCQHTITIPKSADLKQFIQSLSTSCSLRDDDEALLLASVYNSRIIGYLEDPSDSVSIIRDGDRIVAYRLQKDREYSPVLVFVHQKLETIIGRVTRWRPFGVPLIAQVPQTLTGTTIRTEYLKSMNPFLVSDQSESATCQTNEETLLQFHLTDERGQTQLSKIEDDEPVPIGITQKRIYILVSWYEKQLDRYDFGLMSNLPEVYKSSGLFTRRPQESISLYSCLDAFLKDEPLGPNDMWYCPTCKEHRQASKKLDLWRLPEVLIIHLKRFSYSRFIKHKLDTSIDFPIHDFDLSKYISHTTGAGTDRISTNYRLYAISNHYGNMGGGHYTAHAYQEEENKWYNFDDRRVSPISEESIKASAAYVLFYRRI